mmetsp:Transcript_20753/g.58402  ORF Transcript_20753/g.58402 Transcript_20753/m.58402 type:complete len:537 (+) Transcript_20753:35-1645(+)
MVASPPGGRQRAEVICHLPGKAHIHGLLFFLACGAAAGVTLNREHSELVAGNATVTLPEFASFMVTGFTHLLDSPEGSGEAALTQLAASVQSFGLLDPPEGSGPKIFMNLANQRIAWDQATRLAADSPSVEIPDKGREKVYITREQEPRDTKAKPHPKPQVTLFKVVFGCCFLLVLLLTVAARQFAKEEDASASASPQPPATEISRKLVLLKATATVILWMLFSIVFIIFNKYMFSTGGFPYPVTLTAMHMGSCYAVFSVVRLLPQRWRHSLMPDADKHIPCDLYLKGLVPAALLMAVCLGIGNLGFLYATVAFIQMIKPVNIVVTTLAGFAWGLEPATQTHFLIAVLVSGGVAIAAAGEVEFSVIGLICQLASSTGEGMRLIILQGIMQGSLKLDPLTTIYRFTPVAGLALCVLSCIIEGPVNWSGLRHPGLLVANLFMAVILNVLIAAVVHQTSAVVFVLAGVTKDVATIAISSAMYRSVVTKQEVIGYAISMLGICMYKVYKDHLRVFQEHGTIGGVFKVAASIRSPEKAEDK